MTSLTGIHDNKKTFERINQYTTWTSNIHIFLRSKLLQSVGHTKCNFQLLTAVFAIRHKMWKVWRKLSCDSPISSFRNHKKCRLCTQGFSKYSNSGNRLQWPNRAYMMRKNLLCTVQNNVSHLNSAAVTFYHLILYNYYINQFHF